MTEFSPSLAVKVDVTNPGQFFACCGLLELAHRIWPGAEGWFELQSGKGQFFIGQSAHVSQGSSALIEVLRTCPIEGLSDEDKQEKERLEASQRELKKKNQALSKQDEERRKALGSLARAGDLNVGVPFSLRLDWWQTDDDEVVKTWAGKQEIHNIARAAQDALFKVKELESLLDYSCVLYTSAEYRKKKADGKKSVAPFYFDARQFAHRLDTGFSLDALKSELVVHPAVELLTLIGLQRFRPTPSQQKWHFEYWAWSYPIPAPVAAAVVCGRAPIEAKYHYRFRLLFRDDQRRYKAFSFATLTPTGE
jgi:CRISPR-associated protein Csb3